MKTAISIPDELFRAAEAAAKRLGLARSELYRRALAAYLERHNERLVTDALNEVYTAEPELSDLDPILEQLQNASIEPEDW